MIHAACLGMCRIYHGALGLVVYFEDGVVNEIAALVVFGQGRYFVEGVNFGVNCWEPVVGGTVVYGLDTFAVARVVGVDVLASVDALDGADILHDHACFPAGGGDDALARGGFDGCARNGSTDVVDEDIDAASAGALLNDALEGCFGFLVLFGVLFVFTVEALIKVQVFEFTAVYNAKDRKSTRLNSSHVAISYAVFCLKKKNKTLLQCAAERTRTHY